MSKPAGEPSRDGPVQRAAARGQVSFSTLVGAALDKLDEGIMVIDPDQRICLWNAAFLEMLELPAALVVEGADAIPLVRVLADRGDYGPGDPAVLTDQIAGNLRRRIVARGERQMANGKIIDAEWLLLRDGHFMFRLRDVTSERLASRFKDEIIATVSHELRTPLTAIVGALGLLKGAVAGASEAQVAQLIDLARQNSDRLSRLVDELIDVDQLHAGSPDLNFASTDIGAILALAVERNSPFARNLDIAVDLELPGQPVIAEIDREKLLQVMSNLLSNAAKFSPAGSRVRVQVVPGSEGLRISVIDQGRGMSAEFSRRLFTRFAQENRNTENGQAGTGLGLVICKSAVEQHGGQIHVDTRKGVGTIFHVDLPYHQVVEPTV